MSANKIYVRVKRSREEEPAENLCILEEAAPAKKRSNNTGVDPAMGLPPTSTFTNAVPRKLILSRVRTLRCADDALIHESSNMADRGMEEEEQQGKRKRVAAKVIVTSGTRTVTSDSAESYVIIDMAQMPSAGQSVKKNEPASKPIATSCPASKILDPATRMLEKGIDLAVKNGDFNEISSALMQGANAEHQSKTNGFTALMAATVQCNVRMVKRLLMKGVDVYKTNNNDLTALELLKVTNRNMKDAIEIQGLLQAASAKASQPSSMRAATIRENIKRSNNMHRDRPENGAMELDADYVYDIYCVNTDAGGGAGAAGMDATAEMSGSSLADHATTSTDDPLYSIVRVEGLKIHDDGKVELMMAYDSDWSDLGDDEEPDSNDERFYGNDYPEDEENDGEEVVDESDEELAPYRAAQQKHSQRQQGRGQGQANPRSRAQPSAGHTATSRVKQAFTEPAEGRKVRFSSATAGGVGPAGVSGMRTEEQELDDLEAQECEAQYCFDDELSDGEGAEGHNQGQGYSTYYDGEGDGECENEDCDLREDNSDYDMDADDAEELVQHRSALLGSTAHSQQQPQHSRSKPAGHMSSQRRAGPFGGKSRSSSTKLSSESDLLYGDDDNLPAFERRFGVGKVLRPQLITGNHSGATEDFSFADQGLYEQPHTTESLQALWGEEEGNREKYTGAEPDRDPTAPADSTHGDRLQHMRQRTGMVFAAAAREFDPHSGLAKYGADLSDDEGFMDQGELVEAPVQGGANFANASASAWMKGLGQQAPCAPAMNQQAQRLHVYRSAKPPPDTVAYDSELDASD